MCAKIIATVLWSLLSVYSSTTTGVKNSAKCLLPTQSYFLGSHKRFRLVCGHHAHFIRNQWDSLVKMKKLISPKRFSFILTNTTY